MPDLSNLARMLDEALAAIQPMKRPKKKWRNRYKIKRAYLGNDTNEMLRPGAIFSGGEWPSRDIAKTKAAAFLAKPMIHPPSENHGDYVQHLGEFSED